MINLDVKIRNLTVLPSTQVAAGENVTIFCDVVSNADKHVIKWFKDEKEISQEASSMLTLENIKIQDSGKYKCQATGQSEIFENEEISLNVNC